MEIVILNQCRICLESSETMIDLFEDSKTPYKLELCCGVEIPNNPSLPSLICKKCSDILNIAYGFRVLCQRSQEYLSDQHNILDTDEPNQCLTEVRIKSPSPKLELIEVEEDQQYNDHEDDHHDTYECIIEDQNTENNKADEDAADDQNPPVKMFKSRPSNKKPKAPITLMCNICGNLFKNKTTFNYHMKLHRNDKKYECEICSKRFMQTCELRAHIRVHTGEKPYNCSYCDRKFRDRSGVTRHERTHTNERPYGCTICGATFSYSATLKKHERVHTGEKPFRCKICNKGFSEAHQMKSHFGTIIHAEMAKKQSNTEILV